MRSTPLGAGLKTSGPFIQFRAGAGWGWREPDDLAAFASIGNDPQPAVTYPRNRRFAGDLPCAQSVLLRLPLARP